MTNKKKEKPQTMQADEIPIIMPSEAPRVYATGAFGGYSPQDFRIMLCSEEPLEKDAIILPKTLNMVRELQAELILSPLAAKELANWLVVKVEEYENDFGAIAPKLEKLEETAE
ncbi:MAG: DUF3467 domain-containing protein [Methanobacteriales archaeon HGW-Methanobacteriales-1]|jgi:hypothetical protein|nr:MAG: DUF3467 domain-containing protein [Methanobacteriales archaeon HGW-Methanobacteriales-1]